MFAPHYQQSHFHYPIARPATSRWVVVTMVATAVLVVATLIGGTTYLLAAMARV